MENKKRIATCMSEVYQTLQKEGYNPESQITGYILSGDPTYITSKSGARVKMQVTEPSEILELLLESYFAIGQRENSR